MVIGDFISDVFFDIRAKDKFLCISEIVKRIRERDPSLPDFTAELIEREVGKSTGLSGGVAMPRSFRTKCPRLLVAVAVLDSPIPWGTESPANVVFLVAASAKDARIYLRFLITIVGLLNNPDLMARIRAAPAADQVRELLGS